MIPGQYKLTADCNWSAKATSEYIHTKTFLSDTRIHKNLFCVIPNIVATVLQLTAQESEAGKAEKPMPDIPTNDPVIIE